MAAHNLPLLLPLLPSYPLPPPPQDITYSRSINTGWKPPLKYRLMSEEEHQVGRIERGWFGALLLLWHVAAVSGLRGHRGA